MTVSGHKIDAIRNNSKASFCIVGQDKVVPAEYTTRFRSVAGFGKAYIVEEEAERLRAFRLLAEKFCMSALGRFDSVIKDEAPHAEIVALEIEHMTGKEAIELNRMR